MFSDQSVPCGGRARYSVPTRDVPLENKVDTKCIKIDIFKNIARMTRRLCVFIMSYMHFRMNLHSAVECMSKMSLLETDTIS